MDTSITFQIIGYIGSALIIISMMMTKVRLLRILNIVGCVISFIYGLLILSYPVVILNFALIAINTFQLIKIFKRNFNYELADMRPDSICFSHFIKRYEKLINLKFPNFNNYKNKINYVKSIYCDNVLVGIIAGNIQNGVLDVYLDVINPEYKKVGYFKTVYEKNIKSDNITRLNFNSISQKFRKIYTKFGCKYIDNNFIYDMQK